MLTWFKFKSYEAHANVNMITISIDMKRMQMLTCAKSGLNYGNCLANFTVKHGNIIHGDVFAWLTPCQHMLTRCVLLVTCVIKSYQSLVVAQQAL